MDREGGLSFRVGFRPADLEDPFVRRELLRVFMEIAPHFDPTEANDADDVNVQVSECLAGEWRGFGPKGGWRTDERLGAYIVERMPLDVSASEPEDWAGLGSKISGAFCRWQRVLREIAASGAPAEAMERSLDWMCSLLDGTLDATHPGVRFSAEAFIRPAAP